jgi:hypothetical protein
MVSRSVSVLSALVLSSVDFRWTSLTRASSFRSDYINPIDLCNRLNAYIIPEAAVHAFLTFLFVINGYWLAIFLNLPLLAFNAKKYVSSIKLCASSHNPSRARLI